MVGGRALVTGATGGLGRILTAILLAQGREVIATGRDPVRGDALCRQGARFVASDLAGEGAAPLLASLLPEVETVFHLAALSSPWGRRADFVATNLTMTQRLLAAASAAGCKRFLFASTPSIYTRAAHQLDITEASQIPDRLVNAYAQTKLAAELVVRVAAAPGFATVALRPRAVIGPHDTRAIA